MSSEHAANVSVPRDLVRAFQLRRHHLDRRLDHEHAVTDVAGVCGVQDSPPGSAAVAIGARVSAVTVEDVEHAVTRERTLVRTWAMRGAPFVVPTADLSVFTTGVLPVDEDGRTNLIYGVRSALDHLSVGLDELVSASAEAVARVLSGERLDINELGRRVAEEVAPTLSSDDRAVWESEGPHAQGQPVGEAVVHFCVRLLTLQQLLCFAPRDGRTAPFVLVAEWLDDTPTMTARAARRELAVRYLRAHGPSSRSGLATWLGINSTDAVPWWDAIEDDVLPIDVGGSRRWLLNEDLQTLEAGEPASPTGARLLPPGDPFLQVADRDVLLEDRERQQRLWRSPHAPGAVLVDGEVVGTWRSRRKSGRLEVTVDGFDPLPAPAQDAVVDEAQIVAMMRGADRATVDSAG